MRKSVIVILVIMCITGTQTLAYAAGSAERMYEEAEKSYLKGDYEEVLSKCEEMLQRYRSTSRRDDAYMLMGLAALKLGYFTDARMHFGRLISQRPASPFKEDAYLGLADSYLLEKNYEEAKRLYCEMLSKFPDTDLKCIVESRLKDIEKTNTGIAEPPRPAPFYTLQLGSFANKKNAEKLCRKFKQKGYSAYILTEEEGAGYLYKVRIGKFDSREKAEELAKKLKKQGCSTSVCAWQ